MNIDVSNFPFPVKYAVIPIFHYDKDEANALGYIVSKVFIISETTVYKYNGSYKEWQIVPPTKGYYSFNASADIRIPIFDQTGHCKNQETSKLVFETYENAKKECNVKNGQLFREYYFHGSYDAWMESWQNFENKVFEKTSSFGMNITENKVKKITK